MDYNSLYKNNKNVWGKEPNVLLQQYIHHASEGLEALDIGCGQGRDVIFLAHQGFKVLAIDSSKEAIEQLNSLADELGLSDKISTQVLDAANLDIEQDKYSLINIFQVLHFLKKRAAARLLSEAIGGLKENGVLILSCFSNQDPGFADRKDNAYFSVGELQEQFGNTEIILCTEKKINDPGHPGRNKPHQHQVVYLVVKKN